MAFTEKVSLSGTALSLLLYECSNSQGQEGFLLGDITWEITNHISDTQSDNERLDTEIVIRNILPWPTVAQFYTPSGKIKEDAIKEFLGDSTCDIVGWYKYRKNNTVKPTFRDRVISRALQLYFEKSQEKKIFVTCNITSKESPSRSTHSFVYKFGKFNCFDMYDHIEDISANLGERTAGYRRVHRRSPYGIFKKIIKENNIPNESDAILRIQKAVDDRLKLETKITVNTERTIRELEAEIKEMNIILLEKQFNKINTQVEIMEKEKDAENLGYVSKELVQSLLDVDKEDNLFGFHSGLHEENVMPESGLNVKLTIDRTSPVFNNGLQTKNSAWKKPLNLNSNREIAVQDLIDFTDPRTLELKTSTNYAEDDIMNESSPEY